MRDGGGPGSGCSAACRGTPRRAIRRPISTRPSATASGWSCPSRRLAALRDGRAASAPARLAPAARARRSVRPSPSGEPMPPLALWVQGRADLASLAAALGRRSSARGPRPRTASTSPPIWPTGWPAGRHRRLRRRVRHRRRGASRRARRGWADGHRLGRRARPAVPARQRRAVRRGRRAGSADLGEPAGRGAAAPSFPHPQPPHRRVVDRHRGGRGGAAVRRGEHRRARRCAGPAADGGARAGHLADVGGLPRRCSAANVRRRMLVTCAADVLAVVGAVGRGSRGTTKLRDRAVDRRARGAGRLDPGRPPASSTDCRRGGRASGRDRRALRGDRARGHPRAAGA